LGGQSIERREILRYIGIAAVAGSFPGFSRWAFACPQGHSQADPKPKSQQYKRLFFSADQFHMVEQLAELIIPEDETPGAKQAGVAEFIDFMVANRVPVSTSRDIRSTDDAIAAGNEAQTKFVAGLNWINTRSQSLFKREFMKCSSEQQNALLEELAYKDKFKPTTEAGRAFFQMMRDYTVVGYFTTKIGLETLGYPGLQPVWTQMPGCPHKENPEHKNLSKSSTASVSNSPFEDLLWPQKRSM
jgi:gluconate 2-dehydrogenase gamma chain